MKVGLVSLFNGISTFCRLFNAKAILQKEQLWYYLTHNWEDNLFTNPSAQAGYDTRSIFKRSSTGFHSEFSFSKTSCLTKAEEPSWEDKGVHTFPKGICPKVKVGLVSLFNGISTFCRLFNAKAILQEEQLWYYLTHNWEDNLFTNPSAQAGYDTRSIFKRSSTGFHSEFSFSKTSCLTKAEEPSWEDKGVHTFPKGICPKVKVGLVSLFNGISTFCRLFNAKAILQEEQLWYYLTHNWEDNLFTNPSAQAGYDTRSIFKRSSTGFHSEFSFSKTSCLTKAEEPSWEDKGVHTFPKGICPKVKVGLVSLFNGISTFCRLFNAKAILQEEQLWYYLTHNWEDNLFTNPSAQAGYDTRSIFKWSSTGFHSEFSFSKTSCLTKAEEPSWDDKGVHTSPKGICPKSERNSVTVV